MSCQRASRCCGPLARLHEAPSCIENDRRRLRWRRIRDGYVIDEELLSIFDLERLETMILRRIRDDYFRFDGENR